MTGLLSFPLELINWFRLQDSFLAITKKREKEEDKKGENKENGCLVRYLKLCRKFRWTEQSCCCHLGSTKLWKISKANSVFLNSLCLSATLIDMSSRLFPFVKEQITGYLAHVNQ